MAKSISEFKSYLRKGGARPNLFLVTLNFPNEISKIADIGTTDFSSAGTEAQFLVKSAQIPASNIGTIEVPFRGRMLKVAGDRTFEPWSITVINDGEFRIRRAFETWSRGINALTENASQLGYGSTGGATYCADMVVQQLSRDGQTPSKSPTSPTAPGNDGMEVIRSYKFFDAWPSSISSIDLNYDANDQIEEFTVEFQYNYFEVTSGI